MDDDILPSYQDAIDGNLVVEPVLDLDAEDEQQDNIATSLLMDNEEDELSEEEDDNDLVEDSLPGPASATGDAAVPSVDGGAAAANDRTDDEETHRSVLFEGDYFPSIPANVLAELEALDAEEDDVERGADSRDANLNHDAPTKYAEGIATSPGTFARPTASPSATLPSGPHFQEDAAMSPPARASASSATELPAQRPPSPGQVVVNASPLLGTDDGKTITVPLRSSREGTSADHSAAPAAAPVQPQAPRKRVRWADQIKGKSVLHHAPRFVVPGMGPSTVTRRSNLSAREMPPDRRTLARDARDFDVSIVFTECVNTDGSLYLASRGQRPSRRFAQWKTTALHGDCITSVVPADQASAAAGDDDASSRRVSLPREAAALPDSFQAAIERYRAQPKQHDPSPPPPPRRVVRPPRTMYAALCPDLPPLLGHIALNEGDRFATKLLVVSLPGAAATPLLDDAGLMAPPLWLLRANPAAGAVSPVVDVASPRSAMSEESAGLHSLPETPQAQGTAATLSPSGPGVDELLQTQYRTALDQRQNLLCIEDGSLDGPIRIAL